MGKKTEICCEWSDVYSVLAGWRLHTWAAFT